MANVAWSVDYPLSSSFAPANGPSGVLGATATPVNLPYAGWGGSETNKLLMQSGSTSPNFTKYLEVTLNPDGGVVDWDALTLRFSTKRRNAGTTRLYVYWSLDGYTTALWVNTGITTTQINANVDLSAAAGLTGPLTLRFSPAAASGATNGIYLWGIELDGTYDNGVPSISVSPSGIASSLLVGSPALTLSAPAKVVKPSGVASALAVGTPSFSAAAPAKTLRPAGIASTAAVGLPWVHGVSPDPTEWVPLPDGDDVLAFLGWPAGYEGQVQAHVDVITALARAYTRRNAFGIGLVRSGVRAVIVAASARLVANPEQHSRRIGSLRQAPGFEGWTLAERAVLNDYRKVAR